VCHAMAGNSESSSGLLERVAQLVDSDAGRAKRAVWGAERYVLHKTHLLPPSLSKDEASVAVFELMVLWDRADSLPPKLAHEALCLFPEDSGDEQLMMLRAPFLLAAGNTEEGTALLDALIASSSELERVLLPVPHEEEGDRRHIYVFARYLRAKLLLRGTLEDSSGMSEYWSAELRASHYMVLNRALLTCLAIFSARQGQKACFRSQEREREKRAYGLTP